MASRALELMAELRVVRSVCRDLVEGLDLTMVEPVTERLGELGDLVWPLVAELMVDAGELGRMTYRQRVGPAQVSIVRPARGGPTIPFERLSGAEVVDSWPPPTRRPRFCLALDVDGDSVVLHHQWHEVEVMARQGWIDWHPTRASRLTTTGGLTISVRAVTGGVVVRYPASLRWMDDI